MWVQSGLHKGSAGLVLRLVRLGPTLPLRDDLKLHLSFLLWACM